MGTMGKLMLARSVDAAVLCAAVWVSAVCGSCAEQDMIPDSVKEQPRYEVSISAAIEQTPVAPQKHGATRVAVS